MQCITDRQRSFHKKCVGEGLLFWNLKFGLDVYLLYDTIIFGKLFFGGFGNVGYYFAGGKA